MSPLVTVELSAGEMMLTVGTALGRPVEFTLIDTDVERVKLPESVTAAVMVWIPSVRETLRPVPVPKDPSMLDSHIIFELRIPSS
jgi:hypothetical protein